MSAEKLRVGIIGMGFFAANSHVPDLRGTGRAEVVAAARRSADRLAMAKRELDIPATYTDWREMLAQERLDAVVVSTPHDQHVEPTVAALELDSMCCWKNPWRPPSLTPKPSCGPHNDPTES